ncbi:hypothetical protein PI124_g24206, partial [Phytophthora idaei]
MSTQNPEEMLFLELKTRFSDGNLAKVLVVAARGANSKNFVHALEEMQRNYWLKGGGGTVDDIFNLLKLSENSDELMFSVIKKHYDDDILDKLFVEAKKEGNYENHCLKIGGGDVAEPRKT